MSTIKVSSGPHKDLSFIGHENAEAYDKQAGVVGACVETADISDAYRSLLPEAHVKFAEVLAKSGIERGVNADATRKAKERAKDPAKVEDVKESYTTYANRVKATLEAGNGDPTEAGIAAGKAQWKELDDKVHEIAAAMTCDSSPTARQKGPDKSAIAKADEVLAREDAAIEATVTKLLNGVEGFDLARDEDGKPTRDSLARLVQEFMKASV